MKPKPKQELEQLVEEQESEAEAEAEAQKRVSPYRENAGLSYKLDIPRDVSGLVELLEERKGLDKIDYSSPIHYPKGVAYAAGFGFAGMLVVGSLLAYYKVPEMVPDYPFLAFITPGLIGTSIGFLLRWRQLNKAEKEFQQQKESNTQLIEAIDQKLSHYETNYGKRDFVLVDDPDLGYAIGRIDRSIENYHSDKKLYLILERGVEEKGIPLGSAKIVSLLRPIEISLDDLRSLSPQTPILLNYKPHEDCFFWDPVVGFLRKVREDAVVISNTLTRNAYTCSIMSPLDTIKSGDTIPYVLVPEIKPRI